MHTDIGGLVRSFLAGVAVAIPVVSEEEWQVHVEMMHVADPKKRSWWNRKQSESHHDNHHDAYDPNGYLSGPGNDGAVDKFGPIEVAKVFAGNAVLGIALSEPVQFFGGCYEYNPANHAAFAAGFLVTAVGRYIKYESLHHAMHFWEARRNRSVRP